MKIEALSLSDLNRFPLALNLLAEEQGIFLNPTLLSLWEKIYRWKLFALTDGQALFVGLVKSTLLGRMLYSLPFGWYGGFQGSISEEFMHQVLSRFEAERFLEVRIVQFTEVPFLGSVNHYQSRAMTTYLLDLSSPPHYSSNTIRNLRKARAHSLVVKMLTDEHLRHFLYLKNDHEKRTGEKRKVRPEFYRELFNVSLAKDAGIEIYGALSGDELFGCQIYFINAASVFYFDGFSSPAGLETCANFLLTDHVIRSAERRNLRSLNFGSSPVGDVGLERYKSGWGAKSVTYQEYYQLSRFKKIIDRWRGRR